MPVVRLFPDVQDLLVTDLQAVAGEGHTGTETPDDLAQVLPFARIRRTGGPSDAVNDYAAVDIEVFAATYRQAERLAQLIRERLVGPPPVAVIDRIQCDIGPRELPWGDGRSVRRIGASYTVVSRRHAVTV